MCVQNITSLFWNSYGRGKDKNNQEKFKEIKEKWLALLDTKPHYKAKIKFKCLIIIHVLDKSVRTEDTERYLHIHKNTEVTLL